MKYDIFPEEKTFKKEKKKKRSYFGLGLGIYVSVLLLACFITFFVFYRFMAAYEESQPKSGMAAVIKTFESGDITPLIDVDSVTNIFSPSDLIAFIDSYNAYITGKQISIAKSKDYTDAAPIFIVKANDEPVARVTLKSQKMEKYNLNSWSFDALYLDDYSSLVYEPVSVKIRAPKDADIIINNIDVKKERSDNVKVLDELDALAVCHKYNNNVPTFTEYEISGMVKEPSIKIENGLRALPVTKINDTYIASLTADSDGKGGLLTDELRAYTEETLRTYALRFIGINYNISSYVMPGSDFLKTINATVTGFYPSSYIVNTNFDVFSIDNYLFYTDDCFVCEAKYDLCVNFKNYSVGQTHEKGHFYMYFTKKNGKYYFTNIEYIYE